MVVLSTVSQKDIINNNDGLGSGDTSTQTCLSCKKTFTHGKIHCKKCHKTFHPSEKKCKCKK